MEMVKPSQITQESLMGGLERLIKEKAFDDISVSELTKVAGISRMTFYRHYHNIVDVLGIEVKNLLNEFNHTIRYQNDNYTYILQMVHFFQAHSEFVKLLLHAGQQELLRSNVSTIMGQLAAMNNYLQNFTGQEIHYYVEYHTAGLMNVIIDWINHDQPETPEELSAFLDKNSR